MRENKPEAGRLAEIFRAMMLDQRMVGGVFAVVSAVGMAVVGCATSPTTSPDQTADAGAPAYVSDVLREGDVISILCEPVTNINTTVKVPLNGMLDLPFIGQVKATGKTTQQLQDELLALYKDQVRAEVITVTLVQASASVYISGAVLQPGKVPLDRPMTVMEAVMEAGGFDPVRARLSKVTVLRIEGGQQVTYRLDLNKVLKGEEKQVFYLKPFDVVNVPAKVFNW